MSDQTILVMAPFPPLPDSGAGIAIFGDLTELKRRGVIIDLICFRSDRPVETLSSLKSLCRNLTLIEGPPSWSLGAVGKAIITQRPLVVARHYSFNMEHAVATHLKSHVYDAVLVEFSFMFQYLMKPGVTIMGQKRPLFVLDHHVVTPKVYGYFSQITSNPFLKLLRHFEIKRLKRYLHVVLMAADKHLFLGQEDLAYVQAQFPPLDSQKLVYRPTGLSLDRYPLANLAKAEPYTIGFLAAFDWAANVDAVHYLVKEILPIIQAQLPQVKLVLAGRAAPASIRKLANHPAVEFLGEVADMFTVVQRVAVIVAPLRIGAGTRLKILEAMAWGKPVVATSIGVEGVEHTPGQELLVADTPRTFAEAVISLLNNPAQQRQLAAASRRHIELTYTVQRSVDKLLEVISSTLPNESS